MFQESKRQDKQFQVHTSTNANISTMHDTFFSDDQLRDVWFHFTFERWLADSEAVIKIEGHPRFSVAASPLHQIQSLQWKSLIIRPHPLTILF